MDYGPVLDFYFIYFCESNFIFAFGFSECAWLVFGFMC